MTTEFKALPVERNQYGYWTHPLYDEFCDGRESISPIEFNAWLDKNGLEWKVEYRDYRRGADGWIPAGIVIHNRRYGYRLVAIAKDTEAP